MEDRVGFGFRPTDDELVGYYLRYKTEGMDWLVEESIKEINVYNFDPWDLRFQSMVKSRYPVWFFFSKYGKGDRQSRRTNSGFWKITGDPIDVKDRWGIWSGTRDKIGHKKVLVFHKGKNAKMGKTDWVMHEYHLTILPEKERTHVICRVEYKGDDLSFLSDYATQPSPAFVHNPTNSAGSVVDQSVQRNLESSNNLSAYDLANQMDQSVGNWEFFNNLSKYDLEIQQFAGNFNTQEQTSYFTSNNNERQKLWDYDIENIANFSLDEVQRNSYTYMDEKYNEYQPKNPVTKVFNDYSSDSDNESTLFGDTSSSVGSVGNPNELCSTPIPPLGSIDQHPATKLQTCSYESSIGKEEAKMELQGKEQVKNEWEMKMAEDSCIKKTPATNKSKESWFVVENEKIEKIEKKTHKTPKWIYLRNMFVAVLLLFLVIVWTTLLR